jgi:tetratricopeptide (TPR) repeat protein
VKRLTVLGLLLCVTLLLIPNSGFAQSEEDALRIHREAQALQEQAKSNEDLKRAAEKFEEAIRIYQRVGEQKDQRAAYCSVGPSYAGWGQNQKAGKYYEKSLAIRRTPGDLTTRGSPSMSTRIAGFWLEKVTDVRWLP